MGAILTTDSLPYVLKLDVISTEFIISPLCFPTSQKIVQLSTKVHFVVKSLSCPNLYKFYSTEANWRQMASLTLLSTGSGIGFLPVQCQAIAWTHPGPRILYHTLRNRIQWLFNQNTIIVCISINFAWKRRLQNVSRFVQASMWSIYAHSVNIRLFEFPCTLNRSMGSLLLA